MKKIVLVALAVVISTVLVGVLVVGVILSSAGVLMPSSDYVGEDLPSRPGYDDGNEGAPDSRSKIGCSGNGAPVTIRFANLAGRVVPRAGRLARPGPSGCRVVVRVQDLPAASSPDMALYQAMQVIDEAVSPRGWERRRGARWVNRHGLIVTAELGSWIYENENDFDYTRTAYNVQLTGRRAN